MPGRTSRPAAFQVLESSGPDRERWLDLLDAWPQPEIFAYPGFLDLYRGDGDRCCALVYRSGSGTVLQPVLLQDVRGTGFWNGRPLYDACSPPFGYAGPFVSDATDEQERQRLLGEFYEHYRAWGERHGVVADCTRFTPFHDSPAQYPGEVDVRGPLVVRTLDASEDLIWREYDSQLRRQVRKAARSGVTVSVDQDGTYAAEFLDICGQTVRRRGGASGQPLGPAFLDELHRRLSGHYLYVHAWHEGRIVSSNLLLVSSTSTFHVGGGTLADRLHTRADTLLMHECVLWSRRVGMRSFVLGDGIDGEDELFRSKASFAPDGAVPLTCGRWTINVKRYDKIMQARRWSDAALGRAPAANGDPKVRFFPEYRAPVV